MVHVPQERRSVLCDGVIGHCVAVGSLLAGARVPMKDWGDNEDDQPSLGLRIEAALLGLASVIIIIGTIYALVGPAFAEAHPGGLAADGCHNDRKNGGRHCDRGSEAGSSATRPAYAARADAKYYPNCAAVRAAGAAPIHRGEAGYGTHLDRDGDSKACE